MFNMQNTLKVYISQPEKHTMNTAIYMGMN